MDFDGLSELGQRPVRSFPVGLVPLVSDRVYWVAGSAGLYVFFEDYEDGRGVVSSVAGWACNNHWAIRAWEKDRGVDLSVPAPDGAHPLPSSERLPPDLRMRQAVAWAREQLLLNSFYTARSNAGLFLYQTVVVGTAFTLRYPSDDPESEVLPTVIGVPLWNED